VIALTFKGRPAVSSLTTVISVYVPPLAAVKPNSAKVLPIDL
jgi:hypothetical protein